MDAGFDLPDQVEGAHSSSPLVGTFRPPVFFTELTSVVGFLPGQGANGSYGRCVGPIANLTAREKSLLESWPCDLAVKVPVVQHYRKSRHERVLTLSGTTGRTIRELNWPHVLRFFPQLGLGWRSLQRGR